MANIIKFERRCTPGVGLVFDTISKSFEERVSDSIRVVSSNMYNQNDLCFHETFCCERCFIQICSVIVLLVK